MNKLHTYLSYKNNSDLSLSMKKQKKNNNLLFFEVYRSIIITQVVKNITLFNCCALEKWVKIKSLNLILLKEILQ